MRAPTGKINFSGIIILLIILSCIGISFLINGVYLLCCWVSLFIILFVLYRNNRPGIIIFAFLTQWLQVVAYVIWMSIMGWDINHLSKHADIAIVESSIGLVIMSVIVALGIKSLPVPTLREFYEQAKLINEKKIFLLYLGSTLFLGSLGFVFGANSGFTQILLTFASLKWVFFLIYGYVSWINKKNRIILGLMILFEFTTSLYSYFSSFKEVMLFTIIMALTFIRNVNIRQVINGMLVVSVVGFFLLTWTSVKGDYRAFLNKGKRQQVIEVSRSEAFSKLVDEVSNLTWEDYQLSINLFLYRVQYIFHLAKTMDRVPAILPYEYGSVWWENVSYVLMPRLFFPDKPIFQATVKTNKYTGFNYSGLKQGSSFSLGYFADSFVDFGYVGMFVPLSLIALFVVFIYRSLYKFNKINILTRYALINVALYDFNTFEADGLFLFGRLVLLFLVTWFLCKAVFPRLQIWLYK